MARVKTVYETSMVCHLWANRHPHAIRNASGNVSAASGRIYSYGSHFVMGAFLDQPAKGGESLILWCTSTYSSTTTRHQSEAWRALSQTQRNAARSIPFGFSDSDLSRYGLPKVAARLLDSAADEMGHAQKAVKYFAQHYGKAARYLETARIIYRYVGDKKAAQAVPVLAVDVDAENRASVKADAARVEREIKCAEWLRIAAEKLQRAKHYRADAESMIADAAVNGPRGERTYRAICQHLTDCRNVSEHAAHHYVKAGKKAAPDCARLLSWVKSQESTYAPLAFAEECRESRTRFEHELTRARADIALATRYGNREYKTNAGFSGSHVRSRVIGRGYLGNFFSRTVPEMGKWIDVFAGDKKAADAARSEYAAIRSRYDRMRTADALTLEIENACASVEKYKTESQRPAYVPSVPPQNLPRIMADYARVRGMPDGGNVREYVPAFYLAQCEKLILEIDAIRSNHAAMIQRMNAEKINAWRAGENVYLPHDVPTMARIKGDTVHTSRGASVPLDHALRLVRMARIVAARGGQSWADGSGPIVGHFRVNYIGADMSARIGCHDFTSEEALRAAEMIESACASVATESTNG